ncbi:MAG TPA: hypothetical protein PLD47_00325 [Aggregatilineales bacterium]|nr:hypothetical protein [Anaerolineales bacterium]HRE46143.1 hypothetical protein [Aggregatilineales bacterium]
MEYTLAYDHRTSLITDANTSALDFAVNMRRLPVSFRATLHDPATLRRLMIAMHEVIISDARIERSSFLLDPVITVHPDEMFFEAFSTDGSVYVRLSAATEAFNLLSETTYGTTNIDFTFALRDALQNLRSSRQTEFAVGAAGFAVQTQVGSVEKAHYEHKVDLPDAWVKGFLQVQSALAMHPFTFHTRPVDLLNAIHFLQENKARRPPTAMRIEFATDQPVNLVLEPWEKRFVMMGSEYKGYPRVVRLWGRKRLELLLPILPYADKVTIGVLGRGLPHFYICHVGAYKFLLMLSGWVRNDWTEQSALDLLAPQTPISAEEVASVYNLLTSRYALSREDVEAHTLLESAQAETALFALCREGKAMYDPTTRRYRSRELFAEPLNPETILAPDPRITAARKAINAGRVHLENVIPNPDRPREIKGYATVENQDSTSYNVEFAVDLEGRLRFATCECAFFRENLLSRGPCEHIMAGRLAAVEGISALETTMKAAKGDPSPRG